MRTAMSLWDKHTQLQRLSRKCLMFTLLIVVTDRSASGNENTLINENKGMSNYFAVESCTLRNMELWPSVRQSLWKTKRNESKVFRTWNITGTTLSRTAVKSGVSQAVEQNVPKLIPSRRFPDLQGILLKVGVLPWPFCLEYNTTTRSYSGYCWEVILEIATRLNFTFSFVQPSDGQWGARKNGTWNGLVGMLDRKEVDLVAMPLTETAERSVAIDFACTVKEIDVRLWILDPRRRSEKWLIFFQMLGLAVSGLLILSIIIVVLLYSLSCAEPAKSTGHLLDFKLTDNFFCLAGTLMKQVSWTVPVNVSGRTIFFFWSWFSLLLSIIYSGTMIATLTGTRTVFPFTTIRGMVSQDVYKWGYFPNSSIESYMKSSRRPLIQRLRNSVEHFSKADPTVLSPRVKDHENKMEAEKYVFIGHNVFTTSSSFNFIPLREIISSKRECFGLPRNSPLKKHVINIVSDLSKYGILKVLWKKANTVAHKSQGDVEDTVNRTMSLKQVKTVFYTTLIGIMISFVTLTVELFRYKMCIHTSQFSSDPEC